MKFRPEVEYVIQGATGIVVFVTDDIHKALEEYETYLSVQTERTIVERLNMYGAAGYVLRTRDRER